eukprot:m.82323 g.82323  ORF g.82323 m.82323 type:complete len:436 (+) comp13403_c0_seq1:98-1405(+)
MNIYRKINSDLYSRSLPLVREALQVLVEKDSDSETRQNVASQFDKHQLFAWSTSDNEELARSSRKLMALLGITNFNERRGNYGIRVLSIDGGGTKALLTIELLKRIEQLTGRPTHEMFDLIAGASTGAILAFSIGVLRMDLESIEQLYRTLSREVFAMQRVRGSGRILTGQSYYDSALLEDIFRAHFGSIALLDTAADPKIPKVVANSSLASQQPQPYLFRNYNLPLSSPSLYPGSCKYLLWQAVRASTAAPGYFSEFKLDSNVHHDGSVLCNNPTAIALHEARRIWGRGAPIECVLSLGTGKIPPGPAGGPESASWLGIASMLINSATDSKTVHRILQDLLPQNVYFRFNPFITEPYLNEYRPEKLQQYQRDARRFINDREGALDMQRAAVVLVQKRDLVNRWHDWLRTHALLRKFLESVVDPIVSIFSTRPAY